MTDITALAQLMKAADEGSYPVLSPDDCRALAEAMAARDKQIAQDFQIKARLCRESNSLFDRFRAAEKRITELESRTVTVKLPADNPAESESEVDDAEAWFDEGWNARGKADRDALVAAGINVEAE